MSTDAVVLGDDDILRVRMRALGLAGLAGASRFSRGASEGGSRVDLVTDVVRGLFALQGQDWRSSKWAVGVRASGTTASDVVAALNEGRIVRSWPMRGTVHLTAAEDIGWMQRLTNERVIAGAPKRREFLGMSDAVLEKITDISLEALKGRSLSRDELATVWSDAGIDWKPNWRYHLIWWLCQNGLTTFGPVPDTAGNRADPEPRLVRADEWITNPRPLEGDEALVEFASRYVTGRGAVTQKDLAGWAMLPAALAKRALELARDAGTIVPARRRDVSGVSGALWVSPESLETLRDVDEILAEQWLLLPAFDEHLLGFTNREPQLAGDMITHIIPGKNGVFLATAVRDGRVVGTWKRAAKRTSAGTDLEFTPLPGENVDAQALQPAIARWLEFYA